MIVVVFKDLVEMMRYLKHVKPPQFSVLHHTDEFDEVGSYELNHPLLEGMEGLDGWSED